MAQGRTVKFLLDTNVISEIRKRDRAHPNVLRWVGRTPVEEMGTSVLVLAEILRGIALVRANADGSGVAGPTGRRGDRRCVGDVWNSRPAAADRRAARRHGQGPRP